MLDYKNAEQLKKFTNDKGKILPRRATEHVQTSKRYNISNKKSKTNSCITIYTRIVTKVGTYIKYVPIF